MKIGQAVYQKASDGRIYKSTISNIYEYGGRTIYDTVDVNGCSSVSFDDRAIGGSILLSIPQPGHL